MWLKKLRSDESYEVTILSLLRQLVTLQQFNLVTP
jgi:hypothetical protein